MVERAPFYLKQWRNKRGYTLERLAEKMGSSAGYISDLEKGKRRYNQDVLEALAIALDCAPGELLMRDPSKPDPTEPDRVSMILERVPPERRKHALDILETFTEKTGTDD